MDSIRNVQCTGPVKCEKHRKPFDILHVNGFQSKYISFIPIIHVLNHSVRSTDKHTDKTFKSNESLSFYRNSPAQHIQWANACTMHLTFHLNKSHQQPTCTDVCACVYGVKMFKSSARMFYCLFFSSLDFVQRMYVVCWHLLWPCLPIVMHLSHSVASNTYGSVRFDRCWVALVCPN